MRLRLGAVILDLGADLQVAAVLRWSAELTGVVAAVAAERVGDTPARVAALDGVGTEGGQWWR